MKWVLRTISGIMAWALVAHAGPTTSSQREERIHYPQGREIYIRPITTGQEVGYVYNDRRYVLFQTDRILSTPRFSDSIGMTVAGWNILRLEEKASTWFFAMTEKGFQFIRRLPEATGTEFASFLIPLKTVSLSRISTHVIMLPPDRKEWAILISYENQNKEKGTFIIKTNSRESTGAMGTYHVLTLNSEFMQVSEFVHQKDAVKVEVDALTILGKRYSLAAIHGQPEHQVVKGQFSEQFQTAPKLVNMTDRVSDLANGFVGALQQNVSSLKEMAGLAATPPSAQKKDSAADEHFALPVLTPEGVANHPTTATSSGQGTQGGQGKEGEKRELFYNGEKFTVYNARSGNGEGVFIQRASDKTIVTIATIMVPLGSDKSLEGFTVSKDGILQHPNLKRQIDLVGPAFTVEATFVPRMISQHVDWLDSEFSSLRDQGMETLPVIEDRKALVDNVVHQVTQVNSPSAILVGESGDKDSIIEATIQRMPRTWRVLDLDPSVIGSEIGISGKFEEKVRKMTESLKTVPVLWIAENFENLKGLGATGDSKRDFLDSISRDLGKRASFRILGTTFQATSFLDKVQSASILQNLSLKNLEELTNKQVTQYLQAWLKTRNDLPPVSADFIAKVIEVAHEYRPVDAEPQRSRALLEIHVLRMINEKRADKVADKSELEKSAAQFYRLDPALRDRKLLKARLDNYKNFMATKIIANEHFIEAAYRSTFTAWSGMASEAGPKSSFYLDGPPGVGKTEIAKAHAAAMGLSFHLIEMNQFKKGGNKGIDDLLSQIAKILKVDPFAVILLDELEKADPGVLEGLLTLMYNKTFTFYQDQGHGQKTPVRGSAVNATFFFTANAVGEEVRGFFNEIPVEEREQLDSRQLESKFNSMVKPEILENLQVERGIPRPLLDRIKVKKIIFPLNAKGLEKVLGFKLKAIKDQAEKAFRSTIEFVGAGKYIRKKVQQAMAENWSTRTLVENHVEADMRFLSAGVGYLENYEEGSSYVIDVDAETAYKGGIVKVYKNDPRKSQGGGLRCERALSK